MTTFAPAVDELLAVLRRHNPGSDLQPVLSACDVAARWHEGQARLSGEPYITHPLAVATIVAELGMGHNVVCAAILHDLIDDTPYTAAQMRAEFGAEISTLVERLSNGHVRQVIRAALSDEPSAHLSQDDIDLLVVKLADRLHNMRTMQHIRISSQIRGSRDTLEFDAPAAHRLGLHGVKHELEELALRVLRPPATMARPRASMRLLGFMAILLPRHAQRRWREEWTAELSMLPRRRERARFAWQTLAGVPRLAWTLQRQAPLWTVSLTGIARALGIGGTIVAITAPGPIVAWVLGGIALAALGLLAALLFARSDLPSSRLATLIRAWRRGS